MMIRRPVEIRRWGQLPPILKRRFDAAVIRSVPPELAAATGLEVGCRPSVEERADDERDHLTDGDKSIRLCRLSW